MKTATDHFLSWLSSSLKAHPEYIAGAVALLSIIGLLILGWK